MRPQVNLAPVPSARDAWPAGRRGFGDPVLANVGLDYQQRRVPPLLQATLDGRNPFPACTLPASDVLLKTTSTLNLEPLHVCSEGADQITRVIEFYCLSKWGGRKCNKNENIFKTDFSGCHSLKNSLSFRVDRSINSRNKKPMATKISFPLNLYETFRMALSSQAGACQPSWSFCLC